LRALKSWSAGKLVPDISAVLEGAVNVYDAATAIGPVRFKPAELYSFTPLIFGALIKDLHVPSAQMRASTNSTP
jgi:hypothetical protein